MFKIGLNFKITGPTGIFGPHSSLMAVGTLEKKVQKKFCFP